MTVPCKYIIVAALDLETPGLEQIAPVIHTGVGKVNAAIKSYEAILSYQPDLVINYGTAGTVDDTYGLVKVDTFVQWDMDVRGLGVPRGVTPYDDEQLPGPKGVVIASGDSFMTDSKMHLEGLNIPVSLIDMEAYAVHRVCRHLRIELVCYKHVTDSTDGNSSTDWRENVAKGAELFFDLLKKQYGPSLLLSSK